MFSAQYRIKPLPNFSHGMNTLQKPAEIDDLELADSENWAVDETSMITSPGYVRFDNTDDGSTPGPFWGIFQFVKSDGTQRLIRQRRNTLEYDSDDTGTWVACTLPITGSPAATTTLTQKPCTFAQLNDTVLWGNGTDSILSSADGITWTIPTYGSPAQELPKANVFNNGLNRIIFFDQSDSPFRIDWSDINTPTTITSTAYQLIDPNNGWKVKGMGKMPDGTNVLFTEGSVYLISNYVSDGVIDVNLIADNVRLSSHQSIVTTENSVIFHAYDGIYEIIGGTVRKISGRITPTGRNYITNVQYVCSAYYNGIVYMSTPDADDSQDYNSQEWMIFKKLARNDASQPYVIMRNKRYFGCYGLEYFKDEGQSYLTLYAGDSRPATSGSPAVTNDNFCFINSYRDAVNNIGLNNEAQTCWFVTKYFTENTPYFRKLIKRLFLEINLQNDVDITVAYRYLPYGDWTEFTTSAETETEINFSEGYGFTEGYGFAYAQLLNIFADLEGATDERGIQFKITTSQINDVTLYSMAFKYLSKRNFR